MAHPLFAFASTIRRLREGPLGSYVDRFADVLVNRGHTPRTAQKQVRIVSQLSRWLVRRSMGVGAIDEQTIERFLRDRWRRRCVVFTDRPALRLFLESLRQWNVVPRPRSVPERGIHPLELSFTRYLERERGLSPKTIRGQVRVVRRFLSDRRHRHRTAAGRLNASTVTGFVLSETRDAGPGKAAHISVGLRSFFRFLRLKGRIDRDLSSAVPSVPGWRLAALPATLKWHQVQHLLRQCDRRTPVGRRDFAILMLMLRLGLRSGEVAALTLDDFRWDEGEVVVRGKGSRHHRLPLPRDVGQSIVAYLKGGRPRCVSRQLFIRTRAPHTGLKTNGCVSTRVRTALARAGLHSPRQGSHLLRHTAASLMLRQGASLFEIGQVLNHRHPDTTALYAKVDLAQLRPLAQPWPGGVR